MSKKLRLFPLLFYVICLAVLMTGCDAKKDEPVDSKTLTDNMTEYLSNNISDKISVTSLNISGMADTNNENYSASVKYTYGDITYTRSYQMNYEYKRPFGWSLTEIVEADKEKWTVSAPDITLTRVKEDLEGGKYLSGYSDGMFESRRLLDCIITSQELDAEYGYSRINLTATLNADNVHENLSIFCEYLLDENNCFVLTTKDISLEGVEVQGKVSDELIREGLTSINFYHEDELSTWRIGEMNKLTYEILQEKLDTENNEEFIKLNFRGEGTYMYVSGTVELVYHFSSGWYLYSSSVDQASIITGMLVDSWLVDEELIVDHIVNDTPFNYDDQIVNFPVKNEMISNLEITDRKITENGKLQTVYFRYDLTIEQTLFTISGYGKYDLGDGSLNVTLWSEIIESMSYSLSGTWTGVDVKDNYIAYYKLSIIDNQNGTLTGNIYVYGLDYKKNPSDIFEADINVIGNIFSGNKFEILEKEWIKGDFTLGINMPVGYYLFTKDKLIITNEKSSEIKLTRDDSNPMTFDRFSNIVKNGGIKTFIENQNNSKH